MKRILTVTSLLTLVLLAAGGCQLDEEQAYALPPSHVAPAVGKTAPEFKAVDTYGKAHALSQYRGKWVVLEWLNHGCPYVRKHYDNNLMQALQKKYAAQGVVWLSVVSSAPGKQGHHSNDEANARTKEKGAAPHAVLVDASGTVGRLYDAGTTPHMFVIDPQGAIVYRGGIDDKRSRLMTLSKGARPHVDIALQEAMARKPVSVPASQPYGCSLSTSFAVETRASSGVEYSDGCGVALEARHVGCRSF
ncbi:MAG TPA: redoxin domain-containing protein [Thermoanaerobaculia bacterium]|nr:redoxin domain-containing protein [Thermoanaerobaculia bacterium]